MSRAHGVAVVSCIAGFAVAAHAATLGGPPSYIEYASTFDPGGGFEYIRLAPDHAVLGHLDHALLSGFFYRDDYSKEYAIDDTATLVTVDTSSGAVTTIGQTPFDNWTHLSITADPSTGLAYALYARDPCTSTEFHAIDLITGVTTPIGVYADACLEAGTIEPDGTYYLGPGSSDKYAVVNLGAGYQVRPWLQLLAQINNLFDRQYATASQLGPVGFTSDGSFIARPFPAVNGQFPIRQATFLAPGAPIRMWFGTRFTF